MNKLEIFNAAEIFLLSLRCIRDVGGWSAVCDDIGRLRLHPSNKISFDTAEAGPGEISGIVGDHSLTFEMTSSNRLKLVPPQMSNGEHRLEILFNGTSFPGAPKLALVQDLEVSHLIRDSILNALLITYFTAIIIIHFFSSRRCRIRAEYC